MGSSLSFLVERSWMVVGGEVSLWCRAEGYELTHASIGRIGGEVRDAIAALVPGSGIRPFLAGQWSRSKFQRLGATWAESDAQQELRDAISAHFQAAATCEAYCDGIDAAMGDAVRTYTEARSTQPTHDEPDRCDSAESRRLVIQAEVAWDIRGHILSRRERVQSLALAVVADRRKLQRLLERWEAEQADVDSRRVATGLGWSEVEA